MVIKGIAVTLYQRTPAGKDPLGAVIYAETAVTVENVLIYPAGSEAITRHLQLDGHRVEYALLLPKTDPHAWDGCTVEFYGRKWRVFAPPQQWISELVPGDWDRKALVEAYG